VSLDAYQNCGQKLELTGELTGYYHTL